MPYTIYIYDNFHYEDESESYKLADFGSFEHAEKKSKKIVDDFLETNFKTGMTKEELWNLYQGFGEDPHIVAWGGVEKRDFSAWDYAELRCSEICSK